MGGSARRKPAPLPSCCGCLLRSVNFGSKPCSSLRVTPGRLVIRGRLTLNSPALCPSPSRLKTPKYFKIYGRPSPKEYQPPAFTTPIPDLQAGTKVSSHCPQPEGDPALPRLTPFSSSGFFSPSVTCPPILPQVSGAASLAGDHLPCTNQSPRSQRSRRTRQTTVWPRLPDACTWVPLCQPASH